MSTRWEPEICAMERRAARRGPAPDRLVAYGSSTIRHWSTLDDDFPEWSCLNCGFGGAAMRDIADLAPRVLAGTEPDVVVMYGGGNDLAGFAEPDAVAADAARFLDVCAREAPTARCLLLTVLPHPRFEPIVDRVQAYNRCLGALAADRRETALVDVTTPLLALAASERDAHFIVDRVHPNERGYARISAAIRAHLDEAA